jgi:hypothetical protein
MTPGTCIHFTGVHDTTSTCGAGVNYHQTFGDKRPGMFLRMPCMPSTRCLRTVAAPT